MKTIIVTPQLLGPHRQNGIGTFASNLSWLLRQNGENITVIYTGALAAPRETWIDQYPGIDIIHAHEDEDQYAGQPYEQLRRRSELVTEHMPADADVIYFHDWEANGFHYLRTRQYRTGRQPLCVMRMAGPLEWINEGNQANTSSLAQVQQSFAERYGLAHSNYAAFPSRALRDFVIQHGWELPPEQRVAILRHPLVNHPALTAPPAHAPHFRRLIYFGRIDTNKGIEVFVDALQLLMRENPGVLTCIEEIVLLGQPSSHRFGTIPALLQVVTDVVPHARVIHEGSLDTFGARQYLADHVSDSLVVIPTRLDSLPFTVIEASLIPGLNLIHSSISGTGEVLNNPDQKFIPVPRHLARKLTDWLTRPPRTELAHYDFESANQGWLAFHHRLMTEARQTPKIIAMPTIPSVDVCLTYFNLPDTLPATLKSLERQTTEHYNLWVINDGSTAPRANMLFAQMSQQYADRINWHFINQPENLGVIAGRNTLAQLGQADYLLFMDADNIARPNMIERFAACLAVSGLDCLTSYFWNFDGDDSPYLQPDLDPKPLLTMYKPLGDCRELGWFMNVFGDTNAIIRRSVFEALGGFNTNELYERLAGAANEDWELFTQLVFAGYRLDVIPEGLFYYRYRADSLSHSASPYMNKLRALEVYRAELQKLGLQHLVSWVHQLSQASSERDYAWAERSHLLTEYNRVLAEYMTSNQALTKQKNTANRLFAEQEVRRNAELHDAHWMSAHVPWRVLLKALVGKMRKPI